MNPDERVLADAYIYLVTGEQRQLRKFSRLFCPAERPFIVVQPLADIMQNGEKYVIEVERLQLGYQAAIVSLSSPTYGRIGLSAHQNSGKTVSATQAEKLALEAERCLGRRPLRRTDLLAQHLEQMRPEGQKPSEKIAAVQQSLAKAQAAQVEVSDQLTQTEQELSILAAEYVEKQRLERDILARFSLPA